LNAVVRIEATKRVHWDLSIRKPSFVVRGEECPACPSTWACLPVGYRPRSVS
jgi:hypothetical protein